MQDSAHMLLFPNLPTNQSPLVDIVLRRTALEPPSQVLRGQVLSFRTGWVFKDT